MVDRTKAEIVEEFDGVCTKIEKIPDQLNEEQEQYHLEFKPDDEKILEGSKTERFHEWIRITPKATNKTVPEGSKLDKYLQEIEIVFKEAKKAKTVDEAMRVLEGKHCHFVRKVLGKSFKGYEAKPSFVPQKIIE